MSVVARVLALQQMSSVTMVDATHRTLRRAPLVLKFPGYIVPNIPPISSRKEPLLALIAPCEPGLGEKHFGMFRCGSKIL